MTERSLSSARLHGAAVAATGLFLLLLLGSVPLPPIVDLPQHLAQIRLLDELLGWAQAPFDRSLYHLKPFAPNVLVYYPLWLLVHSLGMVTGGKALVWSLAMAWVVAIHWLAWRRGCGLAAAVLASCAVLNSAFYWGFASFLLGFPLFLLWLELADPLARRAGPARLAAACAVSVALLWAHSLWWGAAQLWLAWRTWEGWRRHSIGLWQAVRWCCPHILLGIAALGWSAELTERLIAADLRTAPYWGDYPWERFHPFYLLDNLLGALGGSVEAFLVSLLVLWVLLVLAQYRAALVCAIDRPLLSAAFILWALFFFAPDLFVNTIFFAKRWGAPAAVLTLLALPSPKPPRHAGLLAAAGALSLAAATLVAWQQFGREYGRPLREALGALPPGRRVLALAYETPRGFKVPVFLQAGAWAQALKGGESSMSFAELQTGIVVKDPEVRKPWTRDLEWIPDLLKDDDLAFFSHLLVIGPPEKHQALADRYRLIPVVRSHDVGLYENADGAWEGFLVDRRVTDFDQGHHNGSR